MYFSTQGNKNKFPSCSAIGKKVNVLGFNKGHDDMASNDYDDPTGKHELSFSIPQVSVVKWGKWLEEHGNEGTIVEYLFNTVKRMEDLIMLEARDHFISYGASHGDLDEYFPVLVEDISTESGKKPRISKVEPGDNDTTPTGAGPRTNQ